MMTQIQSYLSSVHVRDDPIWPPVLVGPHMSIDDFGFRLLGDSHGNEGKGR